MARRAPKPPATRPGSAPARIPPPEGPPPLEARLARAPDLRLAGKVLLRYRLALCFLAIDLWYVFPSLKALAAFHPGSNAILYADAAHAWLTGADPWQVVEGGIRFAAPPPTLLLFAPFAFIPSFAVAALWFIADIGALTFSIGRLRLAWWWVLFPPIMEGLLDASPEPMMLACLVATGPVVRGIAPIIKVYAIAPLLGQRRWRAVGVSALILIATGLVLPWRQFLADWPVVSDALVNGTANLSAYSVPLLLPFGLAGLAALGLKRAGWLASPCFGRTLSSTTRRCRLPAMTPLLAIGFSLPIPGAPAVAVAVQALLERRGAGLHPRGLVLGVARGQPFQPESVQRVRAD